MKKSITLSALLLASVSASTFASSETTSDIEITQNVDQITCGQFLELGEEYMPMTIGYLYAVNNKGTEVDIIEMQDLVNIEVDSIIEECIVTPEVLAVEAIAHQASEKSKIANDVEMAM